MAGTIGHGGRRVSDCVCRKLLRRRGACGSRLSATGGACRRLRSSRRACTVGPATSRQEACKGKGRAARFAYRQHISEGGSVRPDMPVRAHLQRLVICTSKCLALHTCLWPATCNVPPASPLVQAQCCRGRRRKIMVRRKSTCAPQRMRESSLLPLDRAPHSLKQQ